MCIIILCLNLRTYYGQFYLFISRTSFYVNLLPLILAFSEFSFKNYILIIIINYVKYL